MDSRLVPVKDCSTFLKAGSLIKDLSPTPPSPLRGKGRSIKFLIVGDGPERKKMEEMAEKLGVKAILQEQGRIFVI